MKINGRLLGNAMRQLLISAIDLEISKNPITGIFYFIKNISNVAPRCHTGKFGHSSSVRSIPIHPFPFCSIPLQSLPFSPLVS